MKSRQEKLQLIRLGLLLNENLATKHTVKILYDEQQLSRVALVLNAHVYSELVQKSPHSYEFPLRKRSWSDKGSRSSM